MTLVTHTRHCNSTKTPTFVLLHQNIHTLCWSDLKVTLHKYANPTIQRYCCPSQYVLISISIPLGRSSIQSFVHLAQLWLDAEAAGQRGAVLHYSCVLPSLEHSAFSLLWRLYIVQSLRAAAGDTSQEDPLREDFD